MNGLRKHQYKIVTLILASLLGLGWILLHQNGDPVGYASLDKSNMPRVRSSFSPKNPDDAISRSQFEFDRLKDPQTGRIPDNIRERELAFAQKLPDHGDFTSGVTEYTATWSPRGPYNVGGRTRALAIDLNYNGSSNRRILAGGISGGMYLSEDNGNSWSLRTALDAHASVTCIAQDPVNRNTWYYGTGEYLGNSAAGGGNYAYWGHGVFKSTDNGNTWAQLPSTITNNDPTVFDQFFDIVWNVAVSPTNSAVFAATYGAILRSQDGGASWTQVLGRSQPPFSNSSDVVVASNGNVYAALGKHGAQITEYGVYRSQDGGTNWSNISPSGLNADPQRIVLGSAPSDANTLYALVQLGGGTQASEHQLFRYNAGSNSWSDLSGNIPDFSDNGSGIGKFSSQGGYDLLVKVKPDNPNVFWIGGTNLARSTDGGSTYSWVGGYHPTQFLYPTHHPDQHSITFYPNNPNGMISGHDGGLSQTDNNLQADQAWNTLNKGYLTTQFYALAVDPQSGSNLVVGGLQDNGTWLTESTDPNSNWADMLGGDGAYTAVAPGGVPLYVSSQQGNILRITIDNNQLVYSLITPANATNFQFIAPYLLDPNDAKVMYLAEGNRVWRNSNLDAIPANNQNPTSINWTALTGSAVSNTAVTTLAVAKTPANRLYFGATDYQSTTVLKRVDNAPSNPSGTVITPPVAGGANPSCIAVNPDNGDEIMAIFSNYGVESIWYSSNAGASWSNVEGNLGGASSPSVRWGVIVPTTGGKVYFVATSTGVYSTTALNGNATTWVQEGGNVIGNTVTDMLVARPADGLIVAGTHGRGVYSATLGGGGSPAVASINVSQLNISLQPNTVRSKTFSLSNIGGQPLNYNISVSGFDNNSGTTRAMLNTDRVISIPRSGSMLSNRAGTPSQAPAQALGNGSPDDGGTPVLGVATTDILALDDGNENADDFIGSNDGFDFYWANEFNLGGQGFELQELRFYMRTEGAISNTVYVGVYQDINGNALAEGFLNLSLSPSGGWYTVTLNPSIQFNAGETFYLMIGASGVIGFPAGADDDGMVPNKGFYYDFFSAQWFNLNTIGGFQNGAFLVRAVGNLSGGGNQSPTAVAVVPGSGNVNQSITFDGSQSFDNDGTIVSYQWNFGDGGSSNQAVATHTYTAANTYNWSLTVTDNQGATGQANGQITISAGASRLTVSPTSGSVNPGSAQTIVATFDAQGLSEGTYTGSIQVSSNGGNITLPVVVEVSLAAGIEDEITPVQDFTLEQNYPNPFNPSTRIRYQIPKGALVNLTIYDLLGREVRTLVSEQQPAGVYEVQWDGNNNQGKRAASGVYLYTIQAGDLIQSKKMTLLK